MKKIFFTITGLLMFAIATTAQSYLTPSPGFKAVDVLPDNSMFTAFDIHDSLLYANDGDTIRCFNMKNNVEIGKYGKPSDYFAWPSFVTMSPGGGTIWAGFTNSGNTDDRIYSIDVKTGVWDLQAHLSGNFDLEFSKNRIFVSGLNSSDWSTPNSIFILDTTGNDMHTKIIEIGGNSAGLGVDKQGNVFYGTYLMYAAPPQPDAVYRWSNSAIDSVISKHVYLTLSDGVKISDLLVGAYDCDVDDNGHVLFNSNSFSSDKVLAIWNGIEGNGLNYDTLAVANDAMDWFTMIKTFGDVLESSGSNGAYVLSWTRPIAKVYSSIPPVVNAEFPAISAKANAANLTLNLDGHFSDPDDASGFTYKVLSNSADTVATATINGQNLVLDFLKAGQTNIVVKATSNGQSVNASIVVGVQPEIGGDYVVSDFENLPLGEESYWDGSDGTGSFTSGQVKFPNGYDASFGSWSLWGYTNSSDNTTAGWSNQISAITGAGINTENGKIYGVASEPIDWVTTFLPVPISLNFTKKAPHEVKGLFITNTTYAALSMEDGDFFAKKFGGADGNDPDWFKLSIWGMKNGTPTDSIDFYLADFRFADNSKDYIVKSWQWVELSSLGEVDSLMFEMTSSDVGMYGINTPLYFAVDNIYTEPNTDFTLSTPVADVTSTINDPAYGVSLANVFSSNVNVTKEIIDNSNSSLVSTAIRNDSLILSFAANQTGVAELVLKGTLGAQSVTDTFTVTVQPAIDYTQGVFIVNEDWFGHDLSSVNFLKNNGEFVYRAFRRENHGLTLGNTTQYGAIYGDNFYFVSKQEPRLVVADAKTLKAKTFIDNIGGADGRAFAGITPKKGYITTSDGIYLFNIETLSVGNKIEGTSGETGNILSAKNYVFAVSQNKIYVINTITDTVVKTIEGGTYDGLTQSMDGFVWVGADTKLLSINPYTLDTASVVLPEGVHTPSAWYAWNANSLCASAKENVLYFTKPGGMFSGSKKLYKYTIGDNTSLQAPFITLPDTLEFYGAGVRVSQENDSLYITAKKSGWGDNSLVNIVYIYNGKTGNEISHYQAQDYYWFPAMPVFPDKYAPEIQLTDMTVGKDEVKKVALLHNIYDKDNNIQAAVFEGNITNGQSLASVSIENDTLVIRFNEGKTGSISYQLNVVSNGIVTSKTISINTIVTSIANGGTSITVEAYPNPTNGKLFIQTSNLNQLRVSIYDLNGRLVYNNPMHLDNQEIDITALSAGTYILKVQSGTDIKTIKIVKK